MTDKIVNELARSRIDKKLALRGDVLTDSLSERPFQLIILAPSGYGKSTVVKHLLNSLEYDQLIICSTECEDEGEYDSYEDSVKMLHFDQSRLEDLQQRNGYKKLVVFDDIMGMGLREYGAQRFLEAFVSNSRHYGISIISSVQVLKGIPPAFVANCNHAMIASLNDSSKKLIENLTGFKPKTLNLRPHTFLLVSNRGLNHKVKIADSS